MKSSYDVAIIGGGPAGATFARELALRQPQLQILLVDEKPKTGSKVCGGLLAPDAQKVLAQFDLNLPKSILADPQIFDVKTMDICSGITRNYQRHYLNMDRGKFDSWLLSLVPQNVDRVDGRCTGISPWEADIGWKSAVIVPISKQNILWAQMAHPPSCDEASFVPARKNT